MKRGTSAFLPSDSGEMSFSWVSSPLANAVDFGPVTSHSHMNQSVTLPQPLTLFTMHMHTHVHMCIPIACISLEPKIDGSIILML